MSENSVDTVNNEPGEITVGEPVVPPVMLDRLSHDERLHLEALAQANSAVGFTNDLGTILRYAVAYKEFIKTGEIPERKENNE